MEENGLLFPEESPARHVAGFDYTDRVYMIVEISQKLLALQKSQTTDGICQTRTGH